jgi:hypothetical protein
VTVAEEQARASCAAVRLALGEPLLGTAPERAASWLLLEHPGPWPAEGLPGDLPVEAVTALQGAEERGVRPQLVRRARSRRRDVHLVLLASCRPGRAWLEARELADLGELADLDLDALGQGQAPGFGSRRRQPVVLVCTHGRREVCCARLGRPVARLLDAQLPPGTVWETTHVGGDRFAPNVVALPDGTYHGAVTRDVLGELCEAVVRGRVVLPHLRGRAGLPAAVQSADWFLRREIGELRLKSVLPLGWTVEGDETRVELRVGDRDSRYLVVVRAEISVRKRLTSCASGGTTGCPISYRLVALERLG